MCAYSNGTESPVFENEDFTGHRDHGTLYFDNNRPVRKIVAATNSSTWLYITRVRFLDENDEEISSYETHNYSM